MLQVTVSTFSASVADLMVGPHGGLAPRKELFFLQCEGEAFGPLPPISASRHVVGYLGYTGHRINVFVIGSG